MQEIMEEKLSEVLQKIEAFAQNNRSLLKWAGVIGGILFVLSVASNFLGYRALRKLENAEERLNNAQKQIDMAQANIATVLQYVKAEKERNEYYKTQFETIQNTIRLYEAKSQPERRHIEDSLKALDIKIKELGKKLGFE